LCFEASIRIGRAEQGGLLQARRVRLALAALLVLELSKHRTAVAISTGEFRMRVQQLICLAGQAFSNGARVVGERIGGKVTNGVKMMAPLDKDGTIHPLTGPAWTATEGIDLQELKHEQGVQRHRREVGRLHEGLYWFLEKEEAHPEDLEGELEVLLTQAHGKTSYGHWHGYPECPYKKKGENSQVMMVDERIETADPPDKEGMWMKGELHDACRRPTQFDPHDHDWSRWSRSQLIVELEMRAVDANEPARMDQVLSGRRLSEAARRGLVKAHCAEQEVIEAVGMAHWQAGKIERHNQTIKVAWSKNSMVREHGAVGDEKYCGSPEIQKATALFKKVPREAVYEEAAEQKERQSWLDYEMRGGLTYGGASDHDDVFAFGDEFGLDYKSIAGSLQWLAVQPRPDVAFECNQPQKRISDLRIVDLIRANKAVREVVRNRTEMLFKPLKLDMMPSWRRITMPVCIAVWALALNLTNSSVMIAFRVLVSEIKLGSKIMSSEDGQHAGEKGTTVHAVLLRQLLTTRSQVEHPGKALRGADIRDQIREGKKNGYISVNVFDVDAEERSLQNSWILVSDAFWSLDVVLSFFTAVYVDGRLVQDRVGIAKAYMTSWMPFDLCMLAGDWLSVLHSDRYDMGVEFRLMCFQDHNFFCTTEGNWTLVPCESRVLHGCFAFCASFDYSECTVPVIDVFRIFDFNIVKATSIIDEMEHVPDINILQYGERTLAIVATFMALATSSVCISKVTNVMSRWQSMREKRRLIVESLRSYCASHGVDAWHLLGMKKYAERELARKAAGEAHANLLQTFSSSMLKSLLHQARRSFLCYHKELTSWCAKSEHLEYSICNKAMTEHYEMRHDCIFMPSDHADGMYLMATMLESRPSWLSCLGYAGLGQTPVDIQIVQFGAHEFDSIGMMPRCETNASRPQSGTRCCLWRFLTKPTDEIEENVVHLEPGDYISEHALWIAGWHHQEPGTVRKLP
ncbi:unnamed protein product, partial [Symbiodinium sp. KB8]